MSRVVISGYYGYGNVGDEIVLDSLVQWLRESNLVEDIVVLSADPGRTSARLGVRSVHRYSPGGIIRALLDSRLLLSGGGSLIQDYTSVRSPLYYLGILTAAIMLRRKVAVVGQGIGPIESGPIRGLARAVLSGADYISLRDQGSIDSLEEIGVPRARVRLGADLAFLQSSTMLDAGETAARRRRPVVFVIPRGPRAARHSGWPSVLMEGLNSFAKGEHRLIAVAFQRGDSVQLANGEVLCPPAVSPECADRIVRGASVVVSCRLHGLVLAVRAGVPCIAIGSDPKMRDFSREAGLPWIDPAMVAPAVVTTRVRECLGQILRNYSATTDAVRLASVRFRVRARDGIDGLRALLQD